MNRVREVDRGADVAVTIERRWQRAALVAAVSVVLAVLGFAAGRLLAGELENPSGDLAVPPGAPAVTVATATSTPTTPNPQPSLVAPRRPGIGARIAAPAAQDPGLGSTLRFAPFAGPLTLIDADTVPELNHSVAFDATSLGWPEPIAAVTVNLLMTGPPGSTAAIGPGDRPDAAITFTIPADGWLLIPHLVVATDDAERLAVSASDPIGVRMEGIGAYVAATSSREGRFITTGSARVGSLVTASDGNELIIELGGVEGVESGEVGLAVLRLNATSAAEGAALRVGAGPSLAWPASSAGRLGGVATALITVEPDPAGRIVLGFNGGSVFTADLVGYYTNDRAPESTDGLLVLFPEPSLHTIAGVSQGSSVVSLDGGSDTDRDQRVLVAIEATNGAVAGSVSLTDVRTTAAAEPLFFLGPDHALASVQWVESAGREVAVAAPAGSGVRLWTLGVLL